MQVEDPASRRARESAARMAPGGASTSASAQAAQQADASRSGQSNGYPSTSRPSGHNSASAQAAASIRPADTSRPNGNHAQSQQVHARDMQRSHTLPAPVPARPGERESKEQAEAQALRTTFSPGIIRTPANYRQKGEGGGDTPRASASAGLSSSSNRAVGRSSTMPDVTAQPVAHANSAQPQRVGQHSSMPTAQTQSNSGPRPLGPHSSMPASILAERQPARRHTVDSGSDSTERARGTKPKAGTALTKLQHFADEPGSAGMLSPLFDTNPSLFSSGSSESSGSSTVSAGSTVRDEPQSASSSAAPSRRESIDYADASHMGAKTPYQGATNGVAAMNGMGGGRPSVDREHPMVSREPSGSRAVSREPSTQPVDRRREPSVQPVDRRREPSTQPTERRALTREQDAQRQPSFGDPYRREQAQAQAQVLQTREQERESDQEDGYHTERNRLRPSPREKEKEREREREREREIDRERNERERSERERGRYGERERDRSRARESGGRRASSRQPTSPTNGYYTSPNGVERSKSGDSGFIPSPISQTVSHQSTPNSSRYGTPASARQRTPSSTRGSNPPSLQPSPNRSNFPTVPYAAQQQQQATANHTPPQAFHPGQVPQSSQAHSRSASQQVPAQAVPVVSQPQTHHRSASQQPQYSQAQPQYAQAQPQYQSASSHAQQYSSARAKTPSPQVYANTTPAKATPPAQAYSYPTPAATPAGTPGAVQPTSSASAQASAAAATYHDPRYGHSTQQQTGYSTHSRSHSANPVVPAATQPVSSASAAAAAHQQSRHRQTSGEMAAAPTTKYATPTRNTASAAATSHYHSSATPTPQQAQRSNSGGQTAAHATQYSATSTPYRPAPQASSRSTSAQHVRRGYWNRRGDYLTPEGYIVRAPYGRQYPTELDRYPDGDRHFRNHHGKEAKDSRYQELPNGSAQYDSVSTSPKCYSSVDTDVSPSTSSITHSPSSSCIAIGLFDSWLVSTEPRILLVCVCKLCIRVCCLHCMSCISTTSCTPRRRFHLFYAVVYWLGSSKDGLASFTTYMYYYTYCLCELLLLRLLCRARHRLSRKIHIFIVQRAYVYIDLCGAAI